MIVVIDSGSLINVFDQTPQRQKLVTWLQRNPASSLYLPTLAMEEVLGLDDAVVVARLRVMLEMYQAAPRQVLIAAHLATAILTEIDRQPTTVAEEASYSLASLVGADQDTLLSPARALRQIAVQASLGKDFGFHSDRTGAEDHAKLFGAPLDAETAVAIIEDPNSATGLLLGLAPVVALSGGRLTEEDFLAAPSRYPVANLLAHFAYRHLLANQVPHTAGHGVIAIFRTKSEKRGGRGAWYDNGIASISALADHLITEDGDFKRKCDWLAARNFLRFQTTTLADFVAQRCPSSMP